MQLGHAGAKGSTRVPWEGEDLPLEQRQLEAASPHRRNSIVDGVSDWSEAMTPRRHGPRARRLRPLDPVGCRRRLRLARAALCPWLLAVVVHLAAHQPPHRCLWRLARQPPPLSARRSSKAMREVWPKDSADVGAHLGTRLGRRRHHARRCGARSHAPSRRPAADMIDCSSGQVSKLQKPVYGRMYQAPFADRIRNEAGIADHGRGSDLGSRPCERHHRRRPCRLVCGRRGPISPTRRGRCTKSARIGVHRCREWPKQYRSGKQQLERNLERERSMAAQGSGLSAIEQANRALGV